MATTGAPIFAGLRIKERAISNPGALNYVEYDTGERELYRLLNDPLQLNNVYSTTNSGLKTMLRAWLASLRDAAGQQLRAAEETLPTPILFSNSHLEKRSK